jgi:tRNA pseudouridine38-40 synthase
VEYEGTRYHGSQYQDNASTIQGELERGLRSLTGEKERVAIASRTDAGVHAKGQVASFGTRRDFPPKTWVNALNHHLPYDISVRAAYEADMNFDVRRQALSREYRYYILNRPARSPLWRRFSYFVSRPLDTGIMNRACQVLVGDHDFAPFTSVADGRSTFRRVFRTEVKRKGDMVVFDMEASSFLPHQVRNTVGALIEVGAGRMEVETFWGMAQAGRRGMVGPAAPPHGLCLMKVRYADFPPSEEK